MMQAGEMEPIKPGAPARSDFPIEEAHLWQKLREVAGGIAQTPPVHESPETAGSWTAVYCRIQSPVSLRHRGLRGNGYGLNGSIPARSSTSSKQRNSSLGAMDAQS
ncbi:MAG TPA: hypothetical protein VKU19_30220 [Bryobacteraceae bacterium]|nr:hypothetical protein [Bryobacteraceae bacterium]